MRYREIIADRSTDAEEMPLFEMANLPFDRTGVPGVIFISTQMASHAARVKWYPGRPSKSSPVMSVTIGSDPQIVMDSGLTPREVRAVWPYLSEWITINAEALQRFWDEGNEWLDEEVSAFKAGLHRLNQPAPDADPDPDEVPLKPV